MQGEELMLALRSSDAVTWPHTADTTNARGVSFCQRFGA